MCIYCGTNDYRKIYQHHIGPIPKDENDRTYEIHHVDGDKNNNDLENLICVSIQEHYDIHYAQGDYGACYLILTQRLNASPEEIANASSKCQTKRVLEGTHHWLKREDGSSVAQDNQRRLVAEKKHHLLSGDIQRKSARKQVDDGNHPFMKREDGTSLASDRVKNGTHNFIGGEIAKKTQERLVEENKHHFLGGDIQRQSTAKRVADGTHNLLGPAQNLKRIEDGKHPSQIMKKCEHCEKTVNSLTYGRWHGINCKKRIE